MLIRRGAVQTAQFFVVVADFEIVQQVVNVPKHLFIIVSAVKTRFQTVFADDLLRLPLFRGIPALAHEANA